MEIYYPADQARRRCSGRCGQRGSVSFVGFFRTHSFVMSWDAYQNIWKRSFPASLHHRVSAHRDQLISQHAASDRTSPLCVPPCSMKQRSFRLVLSARRTASAAMGHSMGGGASFLAAAQDTGFRVLVNFAAAETTPSAITTAASHTLPRTLFAG